MMELVRRMVLWAGLAVFVASAPIFAQNRGGGGNGGGRRAVAAAPSHPADVVLGRPTGRSIVVSALWNADARGYVAYGTRAGDFGQRTEAVVFKKGEPKEILLEGLEPNTRYYYQLKDGAGATVVEGSFQTQRAAGAGFVFEVQGDSHPERAKEFDAGLYGQTLNAAAADVPDFYVALGDDFSVDTLATVNAETVTQRYTLQRPFLSQVGRTAAVFLVNGNHEQAAAANLDGTANNVAVWGQTARNRFYPMPGPDGFYSGDAKPVEHVGLLRDYYAWTWGDGLFVVIDPYWHSPVPVDNVFGGGTKTRNLWEVTIGDEQYAWLKKTLEESKAKYKFVFTHHVLGTGRGGIEEATLFEWGGKNKRGADEFAQRRPGWAMPIHQLLVKNGVTMVIQGHDHIFVRQELDGVVYQTVPEPADPNYALYNADAFLTGDKMPNSGRLRVSVGPEKVKVEYVKSVLAKDVTAERKDGAVAFAYEIKAGASKPAALPAAGGRGGGAAPRGNGSAGGPLGYFQTEVPVHGADVILGRPTANAVTMSVLSYTGAEAYVAYGISQEALTSRSAKLTLVKGEPKEMLLQGLKADTAYWYQVRDGADKALGGLGAGMFHTQRAPASGFVFAVQADSHLDENTNTELYRRTLANVVAGGADFLMDLGDTFMTGKHASRESAAGQYLAQRYYLGAAVPALPVFLTVGNHDGEESRQLRGGAESLAVWANGMRKRYFPNPVPDGFFSGDGVRDPWAGIMQDYYAWEWGDGLFVVLNPYWYSAARRDDNWGFTLGEAQYQWLNKTLEASKAKYKFVFIHQLVGGLDAQGRGGVEVARYYEWGGKNADGTAGFAAHRPGWAMPIHDLLVKNHVSMVFHGHDHLFAKQELDGLVYQEVPQPGFPGIGPPRSAAEYGYKEGVIMGGAGHLRVSVESTGVTVAYVRTVLPQNERTTDRNGAVAYTYRFSKSSKE
jgi:phosphodiesterase/alkaline phosphatase D-like protein